MTTLLTLVLAMIVGPDAPAPASPTPAADRVPAVPADASSTAWALAPLPPPVPQPDFRTPVEYIAWYRLATAYAAGDNALTLYGVFLYGDVDTNAASLAPDPQTQAAKDLAKLLESPEHWYPADKRGLIKWMQKVEPQNAHVLMRAKDHQHYASRLDPKVKLLADQVPPALGNARTIGQLLIVRAWRVENNSLDANWLTDALVANMALARHMGEGSTLEEQFFASGNRAMVYKHIRRAIYSPIHALPQWSAIASAMEKYDSVPVPAELARGLYFFEAAALQLLQHFCTSVDAEGRAQVAPRVDMGVVNAYAEQKYPGGRFRPAGVERLANSDPVELARTIHAYYEGLRSLLREPVAAGLEAKIAELEKSTIGAHPELALIVTPIGMPVQAAFRTEAERRLAYLFLKMAIAFKRTGIWPDSLAQLEGTRVAESRIDPFTGKEMNILTVGRAHIPYSIGPDSVDDGGKNPMDIVYFGRVAEEAYLQRRSENSDTPPGDLTSNGMTPPASTHGLAPDVSSSGETTPPAPRPAEIGTIGAPPP